MKPLLAVILFSSAAALTQTPAPRLVIATANGQTSFHIGERTPLTLTFSGTKGGSLAVLMEEEEAPADVPTVSPASGTSDPFAVSTLYNEEELNRRAALGDDSKPLDATPTVVHEDLNKLLRFDEPGTYTLSLTSYRVGSHGRHTYDRDSVVDNIPVRSNSIKLTIVPATPEWQQDTLRRIQRELAKPEKENPSASEMQAREDALTQLSYLGTQPALELVVATLYEQSDDEFRHGDTLRGLSPVARETAAAIYRRKINDPNTDVPPGVLSVLALLTTPDPPVRPADPANPIRPEDAGPYRLAIFRYDIPTFEETAAYKAAIDRRHDVLWREAVAALGHKSEAVKAGVATTLAIDQPAHLDDSAKAALGTVLRSAFPKLPPQEQEKLLVSSWDILRSRELLPAIQKLTARAEDPDAEPIYAEAIALQRWYDLDPDSAMRHILILLNKSSPDLPASDLGYLPNQSFPQFEHLWMQGFLDEGATATPLNSGTLLVRFGTGAASAQMAALIRTTRSADQAPNRCWMMGDALAYLLRFDPATAHSIVFDEDPPANAPDCLLDGFTEAARIAPDPMLTAAAINALQRPEWGVHSSALRYLATFGDDSARKPLLDAFLAWSKRVAARPDKGEDDEDLDGQPDQYLGGDLVRALLTNPGWIPDETLISLVQSHCVTKRACHAANLPTNDLDVVLTPTLPKVSA